tara:strand:- start:738 stop:896 length:159 start_codon:yes stop_codon:yes gene_type:complete
LKFPFGQSFDWASFQNRFWDGALTVSFHEALCPNNSYWERLFLGNVLEWFLN